MWRAGGRCCCPYGLKVDSVGLLNNASHGVCVCVVGTPFGLGCWERNLSSSRADRRDTLFARRLQVVIQVGKRFLMLDGQECCDWRRRAGSEIPQCGARRLDERPGWAVHEGPHQLHLPPFEADRWSRISSHPKPRPPAVALRASSLEDVRAVGAVSCTAGVTLQQVDDLIVVIARQTRLGQHLLAVTVDVTCHRRRSLRLGQCHSPPLLLDRRPGTAQNPPLHPPRHRHAFRLGRSEGLFELPGGARVLKPSGDCIGVMLIGGSVFLGIGGAPEARIGLGDY
jgi:hypothetical protein